MLPRILSLYSQFYFYFQLAVLPQKRNYLMRHIITMEKDLESRPDSLFQLNIRLECKVGFYYRSR